MTICWFLIAQEYLDCHHLAQSEPSHMLSHLRQLFQTNPLSHSKNDSK